ncbi:hypothetical protein Csp2054_14170 [Curtobacterium sp. 'Ferrero']|uniref:helix-turn-helix domain-containing protein n=1 Tax=Curtobacterium sp. 'Ferrero' TaxID=2033654 RepID=UPI000BD080BC|nr:helix-turn-helix domain-containing protein [Curtobacterium sp. 'Ferrero']PCN46985.1 hypothetical protein Csp2054_14170 [Curtobacterium sp. 'Ferrero']
MSGRPITTCTRMAIAAAVIAGRRDQHIADELGVARSSVQRIRDERGLPANHGRGRPTRKETRS